MWGDLDLIVMKALEKNRDRRYASANGLAADLRRYLVDKPVQACSPSAGYRLRKFLRRNLRRWLPRCSWVCCCWSRWGPWWGASSGGRG